MPQWRGIRFADTLQVRHLLTLLLLSCATGSFGQHALRIPDTLSGPSYTLLIHQDSAQFGMGPISHTFAINTNKYLGPTLIMHQGDSVSLMVNNNLGDTTTMHWHGFHVAPANDGGPHSMIMNGMSWNPKFVVRNKAATYWYHPHMMAKTAGQAIKGDMGMIIVRDAEEATLALPRRYGVDDFPVMVQSVELDSNNQFMPTGMVDSVILVNGTDSPSVTMPAQVVRMRLLNASGERTMNFGFTGDKVFDVIGNDGGLLYAPVSTTRIRLSPGERAEILVDFSGMDGTTLNLKSYASELPMGVQGGPTMPMPAGSPPMNSPLNGIDFNVMQINIGPASVFPVTAIPATLVSDGHYDTSAVMATRTINMTADSMMVMDGPFYFNDSLFRLSRIDYRIPLNNTEIWVLRNQTMVAHPFHIHDVHFYILDRNGNAPSPVEKGPKDVVLVKPGETVRFITKFEDFADTTIPYMYHCHILMHEDDGMMGQFVVGSSVTAIPPVAAPGSEISLYPNPAHDVLNVHVAGAGSNCRLMRIYNMQGQLVFSSEWSGPTCTINTSRWERGAYKVVCPGSGQKGGSTFILRGY